ncbi:hypothetical protein ABT093_09655 [Kitasatospora sp. NPDC002551]|uniref:hypothetical protein n=1 Tax=Kitasatospora sp. NPDC002551 TaxID=3154539 RepID=UPI003321F5CD
MTPTAPLPDIDILVREALTSVFGADATVMTLIPDDWAARLDLVVARRVPGAGAIDPRGLDAAIVDIQSLSADRATASTLCRRAVAGLYDACTRQFASPAAGGYLSHFSSVGGGPAELRIGLPAPDASTFRFQATVRLTARPTPVPTP